MRLIEQCIADYNKRKYEYQKMDAYYRGKTDVVSRFTPLNDDSKVRISVNFIKKLIKEECMYVLGNKPTYISKSSDENIIEAISKNLAHWSEKCDQNLCKNMLKFSEAFELYFIDKNGLFSSRIISPLNGYALVNDYGEVELFLHFFDKLFDLNHYMDVYYPDRIEHYRLGSMQKIAEDDAHYFGDVPVSRCLIAEEGISDTLFNDIKTLQDSYEENLSSISSEVNEYRNAYLKITGGNLAAEDLPNIKKLGILQIPDASGCDISWLTKNINDTFIKNTLETTEDKIYQISSHINANESLSSNTSSLALRTRLISLENKCKSNSDAMVDAIKSRLKFLFKYLNVMQNVNFDYRDIKIKMTPLVPSDDMVNAQVCAQLGERLSDETALSLFSFVDNPREEIEKVKLQKEADLSINLDAING